MGTAPPRTQTQAENNAQRGMMLSKLSLQGGDSCSFIMLDAAFVRKFPGKSLPFFLK